MKSIRDCKNSVFVSYATQDDVAWLGWVSSLVRTLEPVLGARARVDSGLPPIFFSGDAPLASGRLSKELREAVADSFAMVIVVHDNYVEADWCLKELEYFREQFGDEGFLERLYIVAMSETAISRLQKKDAWKQLLPNDDQIWLRFFRLGKSERSMPVKIYSSGNNGKSQLSDDFLEPFEALMSSLVEKVSLSAKASVAHSPDKPALTAPGSVVFGVVTAELNDEAAKCRQLLAHAGVASQVLGREALLGNFPEFDAAERLVLPFCDAQPLLPYAVGGHLAVQRDAWFSRSKPAGSLVWLDLRHVPAVQAARGEQLAFMANATSGSVKPLGLLAQFGLGAEAFDSDGPADCRAVHIYIESNQNERQTWRPLGEQIKRKWDRLVAGKRYAPPLVVRPRGLPIDEIEQYGPLHDADGVVLFWGKKEPRSLRSQIDKVEARLSGRNLAPCIVAYLMPPQPDPHRPIVAWVWDVLRFQQASTGLIDVVPEDTGELDGFLQKILDRSGGGGGGGQGGEVASPMAAG